MSEPAYKIVGLMLTRDDTAVLGDWLAAYRDWFDEIFVLDGSLGQRRESEQLLRDHRCHYDHDDNHPGVQKKDHPMRKIVFERIRGYVHRDPGKEHWIVIAHPDEFYKEHLRASIDRARRQNSTLVQLHSCPNVPHTSEIDEWKRRPHYSVFGHFAHPGHLENRIFLYNDDLYYDDHTHSSTLPHRLDVRTCRHKPIAYHYKIQSIDLSAVKTDGTLKNSCWSSLRSHYPKHHVFRTAEDFFLDRPGGKYASNTLIQKNTR